MIFMKKLTTRLLSLVLLGAFIPSFVLADTWYLDKGDITVNATGTIQTVTQGAAPVEDPNPVITSNGKTENTVIINAGENATANVTLENVNIDVSSNSEAAITTQGQGDVTLNLSGNNSVQSGEYHAGVHKGNAGNLTVTTPEGGTGSLNATGGKGGAGIGGDIDGGKGNNITISGGTIVARGGEHSAGIGGGGNGSAKDASNITVSGGNVTAYGSGYAAGIGGGNSGSGADIEITGGQVTATGGDQGAGIGGGKGGNGSDITVSNGTVNATGGNYAAGIGGGISGDGSGITVSGGNVTANGGYRGAGIGGGSGGNGGNGITISDGEVTAQGGEYGAGIGGGYVGNGSGITVSGGKVKAIGGSLGAGIGGGYVGSGKGITIEGGEVTARGDLGGAGIGGGIGGTGSDVTISGDAQVKVQGGAADEDWHKGAAIGNGGTRTTEGNEVSPNTSDLKVGGFIQIYEPGKNINTDTPDKTIEGQKGDHSWNAGEVTAETVPESKAAAYWVSDSQGQSIPYQAQQKDGVLTVTVQADTASLRGTTGSLRQLEAQGITGIRFVTNRAQSDFTLSDLLTSGTGSFTLTHDGETVTFTLAEKDISGILK